MHGGARAGCARAGAGQRMRGGTWDGRVRAGAAAASAVQSFLLRRSRLCKAPLWTSSCTRAHVSHAPGHVTAPTLNLPGSTQVMQMFDKAEAEFRELSDKRGIVENDKNKIRKARAPPRPAARHRRCAARFGTCHPAFHRTNQTAIPQLGWAPT